MRAVLRPDGVWDPQAAIERAHTARPKSLPANLCGIETRPLAAGYALCFSSAGEPSRLRFPMLTTLLAACRLPAADAPMSMRPSIDCLLAFVPVSIAGARVARGRRPTPAGAGSVIRRSALT